MSLRSVASSLFLTVACLADCGAQDAKTTKPQPGGAEKTSAAIDQLRQALQQWRQEIGPEGAVDQKTLDELRFRLQELGKDLQPIFAAERKAAPAAPAPVASDRQARWLKEVRALGDGAAERRAAAVAELQQALAGRDAAAQLAALRVLTETGDIKFDRPPFRPLILPLIETARGERLVAALYALYNAGRQPEDLAFVQAAYARDAESLGQSVSHLLFSFGDGVIAGKSAEIVLQQLAAPNHNTRRETLRGLWGAKVTPEVAARLIELSQDPQTHHDAIYYGLSTLQDKNAAVVDTLIATLADEDWINNGQRALWGLGHGVPEAQQKKVAAALVQLHNSRSDAGTRKTCADLVRRYGGEEMATKLDQ